MSAMISSGAFPNVAFRKPPIPGPVCSAACSVASPISHASGIERECGEDELERLRRMGDVVQRDRERRERERREESLAYHALADPTDAVPQSSSDAVATA